VGQPVQVATALNAGLSAQVDGVSCPSAGNCTASGSYSDARDDLQAFVVSERNGAWGNVGQVRIP
jgi:hypothetical protein